ncbi:MAG: hypothetical protein AB7F36_15445 [Reyranellaceae bacterium]
MRLIGGAVLALLAATMAAQAARAQVQRCPDKLPPAVAAKRDAIVQAATAKDWAALKRLTAPDDFVYSFGDAGDPIGYWQDSLKQGTDVAQAMAAIFAMPCVVYSEAGRREYLWPSAAELDWKALNAREKAVLQAFYGASIDEWYIEGRAKGYYVGWRGSITQEGAWTSFVAGD